MLYWQDADRNPDTDGYSLMLSAIANDNFDVHVDPQLAIDAIDNDSDFEPKGDTLYEIHLVRATIAADPVPEPALAIDRVIELKQDNADGLWSRPIVRM